jgi:hypothetical protein
MGGDGFTVASAHSMTWIYINANISIKAFYLPCYPAHRIVVVRSECTFRTCTDAPFKDLYDNAIT